jgi:hypothetical protein
MSLQCRIIADPQKSSAVFGVDKRVRLTPLFESASHSQKGEAEKPLVRLNGFYVSVECGKGAQLQPYSGGAVRDSPCSRPRSLFRLQPTH